VTRERFLQIARRIGAILGRYAVASVWVYYTLLFLWASGYLITGDRYAPFVILNIAAPYLFAPLPLAVAAAVLTRRRELWIGAGIGALLFGLLWGPLLVPRGRRAGDDEPTLTVMTYNALGYNTDVAAVIEVIERSGADIVLLQELNCPLAAALESELGHVYPYQILDPYDDVRGMGTVSKLPLFPTGESLPLDWVGTPQVLNVTWAGKRVTLVNFHMWAIGLGPMRVIEMNARAREAHALYLTNLAGVAANDGPVVVAGDANATPQSDTYKMLTWALEDAWVEAGSGWGHTYPGSSVHANAQPQFYGVPVPRWLFRIDYVFHSPDLEAVEASVAPSHGGSDHRAVLVTLALDE